MPYSIKKKGDKWVVYNKESGKIMGTHKSKEKAKEQIKALYANVKEREIKDVDLNFTLGKDYTVKETDKKGKWVRIGGEVFRDNITSRKGITYRMQNIDEVDGSDSKFFMTHDLNPRNVVGHVNFSKEGETLYYDAKIRNTDDWTDIVEKARDKMFEVSLDARYKKLKRIKENNESKYVLEGMEMRGLCGVGVGGVPTNSIDYAIAEKFKKKEDGKSVDKNKTNNNGVKIMSEKDESLVKENEELKERLQEMEKSIKEKELNDKKKVVSELCELNSDLKEKELMGKSIETLEVMKKYESTKEKEKIDEGEGEVNESDEKDIDFKEVKGIVIEKDTKFITMSDKYHNEFNEDLKNRI